MRRSLLCLTMLAMVAAPTLAAEGLLKNADFAAPVEGSQRLPGDWIFGEGAAAAYRLVDDDGFSGNDSLRYEAKTAAPAGAVSQTVGCQANTAYLLVAALKSDGTCKPLVRVFAPDLDREVVDLASAGEKTWKLQTVAFNSGAATRLEIRVYGDASMAQGGQAVVGSAAFDDVQVYAAADAPEAVRPPDTFAPPGPNIALGKPYTFRTPPGYGYCTDPGDATQLTDGEYTVGYFWTQKSTVGWQHSAPVVITFDLGRDQPIAGLSYNTAAGIAGVAWPSNALIMTSLDGQAWTLAGDLMLLATKAGMPATDKYSIHRFATDELRTHGRYLALFVDAAPYVFVDEIEVYRGPDEWLALPVAGQPVADSLALFDRLRARSALVLRLRTDLATARRAIEGCQALGAADRAALSDRAAKLAAEIEATPQEIPPDFAAIFPCNDLQARIFALHAPLHRANGLAGVVAWTKNRWDPLSPTEAPTRRADLRPAMDVALMRREYRAEVVNLTNCTDASVSVTVNLTGLPGGRNPEYVSFREVLATDTREMSPIAAALPEMRKAAFGYRLRVPAGMTRQVWVQFRPVDVEPGEYQGALTLAAGDEPERRVPVRLKVYPFDFPAAPSISIGGWDYLNGGGTYDAGPGNIPALIQSLTEHHVDSPWANSAVQPNAVQFDPEGRLIQAKFDNWDEWVGKWPGARNYCVFLAEDADFDGEAMGTPRFNRMVGEWITAWVEHMKLQGLKPEQLVLLIYDEPGTPEGADIIINWAKALNAAQPGVTVYEDPTFQNPAEANPEMYAVCDVLCPNLPMFIGGGKAFQDVFTDWQAKGKTLWFYSCSGPGKLLDPIYYHRSQFWWAARFGATGSFYWAFGDEGGASSFTPYLQGRTAYSPLFLTPTSVVDGKHMEAIREGAQDFEHFVMLRARVAELEQRGARGPLLDQARAMLTSLPEQVTSHITTSSLGWLQDQDRDLMDEARVQVLEMLDKLRGL